MEKLLGIKRKADSSSSEAGLGIDGAVDFSNQLFTLNRISSLLQERHSMRIKLLKLDNQIESHVKELHEVPSDRGVVDSYEKKWRQILASHQKKIDSVEGPRKKKQKNHPKAAAEPESPTQEDDVME